MTSCRTICAEAKVIMAVQKMMLLEWELHSSQLFLWLCLQLFTEQDMQKAVTIEECFIIVRVLLEQHFCCTNLLSMSKIVMTSRV